MEERRSGNSEARYMGCRPKNDDMMVLVRVTVSHMLRST